MVALAALAAWRVAGCGVIPVGGDIARSGVAAEMLREMRETRFDSLQGAALVCAVVVAEHLAKSGSNIEHQLARAIVPGPRQLQPDAPVGPPAQALLREGRT